MSHSSELSMLLHQALEPRLDYLLERWDTDGWRKDPEGVHQIRVASRRVRAVLDLMEPGLYPGFQRHRKHVKQLTKAVGISRELDVHTAILETMKGPDSLQGAALDHLSEILEKERRKARKKMVRDLAKVTLKHLDQLRVQPEPREPSVTAELAAAVLECLTPYVRNLDEAIPSLLDGEKIQELHQLRIRVKRLRYSLEVLASAFPASIENILQELKDLQTALGQHHDEAMLGAFVGTVLDELLANRRTVLAAGVSLLADRIDLARRSHFEQFQKLGKEYLESLLLSRLKHLLEGRMGDPA